MTIQWYPGHMAKAIREAKEKLNLVDLVIECLDARVPISSRNPKIDELLGDKKRLIVFTKVDLADSQKTMVFKQYYEDKGIPVILVNAKDGKGIDNLLVAIKEQMAEKHDKAKEKGVHFKTTRLMILGIPNAGKSTLINRLIGKNQAITANKPGVTQAQRWLKLNQDLELLDTPGILWPKFEVEYVGEKLALTGAIKDSLFYKDDVALFALSQFSPAQKEAFTNIYSLSFPESSDEFPQLLMDLAKTRGYRDDYEKASHQLIYDIRSGKLGRMTFDALPPEKETIVVEENESDAE